MIVRIQASGGSFLGAGKYYLHDKLDTERAEAANAGERISLLGQSDARVWFTDTRNCLNIDPQLALEEMWRTAEDQAQLKMQAGVKRGGRKCDDPVKTISLSWHKDDRPDVQHMIDSADAYLKHMGWDHHQAVLVGHNDTEHRHIHIILNRIDPENGRTLDDYRERKRSQVWALAYEKEHDNVRCEEREVRAAKREQREPELTPNGVRAQSDNGDLPRQTRTPANDHLPHNVIMISRPLERQFDADEAARAALHEQERLLLKEHQRAEREAFFKDGAKLFKATRHAAYDEVRREFKSEWRDFYRDAKAAGIAADGAHDWALRAALDLARDGKWQDARSVFGSRDVVAQDVAEQFAARCADIEERQKAAIAERQRDACDALRLIRDVQYQDVLQRQRNERAAWNAGTALDALGLGSGADGLSRDTATPPAANQNIDEPRNEPAPAAPPLATGTQSPTQIIEQGNEQLLSDLLTAGDRAVADDRGMKITVPDAPTHEQAPVTHQLTDLAAGGIGAAASYLADQIGELFAPTPPEVKEANAKAIAKHEADKPAPEEKPPAYARIIDAAVKRIESERQSGSEDAYWKERDRGKGWERDQ